MRNGFTLVELAIVIVIIGLIVAGVLVGQDLVKQGDYKGVIRQMSQISAGAATFKAKYGQLPGDFSQGVAYNMHREGLDPSGTINAARPITTAGGNGNGILEDRAGITDNFEAELANFWIYLSNSSMLEGYNQITNCWSAGSNCGGVAGTNFPSAKIGVGILVVSSKNKLYYILGTGGASSGASSNLNGIDGNFSSLPFSGAAVARSMSAEEAYSFDSKLDDGDALNGNTTAVRRYGTPAFTFNAEVSGASDTCFTTATTNVYNFATATNQVCSLAVLAGIN